MAREDNVTIGIPELYAMMLKMDDKMETHDERNRLRDEANQKAILRLIQGNGKPGLVGRITVLETKFWILVIALVPVLSNFLGSVFSGIFK